MKNQKGKSLVWKDFSAVIIEKDLHLIECRYCGNRIISAENGPEIDKAITETIHKVKNLRY